MTSFQTFLENRVYFSSAFVFATHSFIFSSWIIYIPHVVGRLNLTEGALGIALFCLALGAVTILPLSHRLIHRFGEGRVTFYSTLAMAIIMPLPIAAPSYLLLCVALYFTGVVAGLMDIAMNALTAAIEKRDGVYIMSGSHGFFSLGGMVGAGLGSFIAALWQSPVLHTILVSASLVFIQFFLKKYYINIRLQTAQASTFTHHDDQTDQSKAH